MSTREKRDRDAEAVFQTMRDMILEAKPDEVKELAREAGLDFKKLANSGRDQVELALKETGGNKPVPNNVVALHKGLNSLLVMLRRRDGIDEAELARKADIDEKEILRIECDPGYLPSPRTIFRLEQAFSLPDGVIARLSGAIKDESPLFEQQVNQFAANAKAMGKLTRAERDLLNAFVQYLAQKR